MSLDSLYRQQENIYSLLQKLRRADLKSIHDAITFRQCDSEKTNKLLKDILSEILFLLDKPTSICKSFSEFEEKKRLKKTEILNDIKPLFSSDVLVEHIFLAILSGMQPACNELLANTEQSIKDIEEKTANKDLLARKEYLEEKIKSLENKPGRESQGQTIKGDNSSLIKKIWKYF